MARITVINILAAPTEVVLSSKRYARTYRLLREIEDEDFNLTVYTNKLEADKDEFHPNISVRTFESRDRLSYFLSLHLDIYKKLRSNEIDVYQHANLGFREFNPAVLFQSNEDIPFLIGPAEAGHAVPPAEFRRVIKRQINYDMPNAFEDLTAQVAEPFVRKAVNPVRERLFGATLDRADRVIAVHSDAKKQFEQYTDAEKIQVIPYGVDMKKFPFSANSGNRSLITVGNLIERKGHRYLLDAMATVVSEFPDSELHIVGTGPLQKNLESHAESLGIEDAVTFHGFVEDEKLVELLHQARAFVHPSLSEGFSHVRLEAMSAGCPIIGTEVAGAYDLTRDGTDGTIVPKADSSALASAANELLSDPEKAKKMGASAREKIERDHDYKNIAQQYINVYRELADVAD